MAKGKRLKKRLCILLIITVFALVGCGISRVKTIITDPEGDQWIILSKADARVFITQEKGKKTTTVEVDNKGKLHWMEGLMQYIMAKPDISISNKEGR